MRRRERPRSHRRRRAVLLDFTKAIFEENWDRPWPPPEITPALFEGKLVLVAEDEGDAIGYAFGELHPNAYAHVNIVYVRPDRRRQGVTRELLGAFAAARARTARSTSLWTRRATTK